MMTLIKNELRKILFKRSTLVILAVIPVVIIVYALLMQFTVKAAYSDDWKASLETRNASLTKSLNGTNIDGLNAIGLGDSLSARLNNELIMNNYYLENNINPAQMNYSNLLANSKEMSFVLIIIGIIIFSGMITDEFEDGKIQALLLQPYKRWQFAAAKLSAAAIVNIALWLLFIVCCLIIGLFSFGTQPAIAVIVKNGAVTQVNTAGYIISQYAAMLTSGMCFGLFAFTLANLFRRKTMSIAIGLGGYFLGGLIKVILDAFGAKFTQYEFFTLINVNRLMAAAAKDIPVTVIIILLYCAAMAAASAGLFMWKKRVV